MSIENERREFLQAVGALFVIFIMAFVFITIVGLDSEAQKTDITQIATSRTHSCAIGNVTKEKQEIDAVQCWGDNQYGQLGNGDEKKHLRSKIVKTNTGKRVDEFLDGAVKVSVGDSFSCAIAKHDGNNGAVKCWGDNQYGQLGTGANTLSNIAIPVLGIDGNGIDRSAMTIASGKNNTCALLSNNKVKCWGDDTFQKSGGDGNSAIKIPTLVKNLESNDSLVNILGINLGDNHSCALFSNNTIKCWGKNDHGQLSVSKVNKTSSSIPYISDFSTYINDGNQTIFTQLLLTSKYTCVIFNNKDPLCFGDMEDVIKYEYLTNIQQISFGINHTCVLDRYQRIKCWGDNLHGQLGSGVIKSDSPLLVDIDNVISISLGDKFSCAVTSGGNVYCWGINENSQLGTSRYRGREYDSFVPTKVKIKSR